MQLNQIEIAALKIVASKLKHLQFEAQNNEFEEDMQRQEEEQKQMADNYRNLQNENELSQQQLKNLQLDLQDKNLLIAVKEEQLKTKDQELACKEKECNSLHQQLERFKKENSELQKQLTQSKSFIFNLKNDAKNNDVCDTIASYIEKCKFDNDKLKQWHQILEKAHKQYKEEIIRFIIEVEKSINNLKHKEEKCQQQQASQAKTTENCFRDSSHQDISENCKYQTQACQYLIHNINYLTMNLKKERLKDGKFNRQSQILEKVIDQYQQENCNYIEPCRNLFKKKSQKQFQEEQQIYTRKSSLKENHAQHLLKDEDQDNQIEADQSVEIIEEDDEESIRTNKKSLSAKSNRDYQSDIGESSENTVEKIQTLQREKVTYQVQSVQLTQCFEKLEKKLANYKHFTKIGAFGNFGKNFQLGNEKLRLSYEILKVDLKEYQKRNNSLIQQCEDLESSENVKHTNSEHTISETEATDPTTERDLLKKKCKDLEEELQNYSKVTIDKINNLTMKLEKHKQQNNILSERCISLEKDLENSSSNVIDKINQLTIQLEKFKLEKNLKLGSKCTFLEDKYNKLYKRFQDLEVKLSNYKVQNKMLKEQLQEQSKNKQDNQQQCSQEIEKKLMQIKKSQNELLQQQYKEQSKNKSVNFKQFDTLKDKKPKRKLIKCKTEKKSLTSKGLPPRVKPKLIESQIKTKKEKNTQLYEHVKELEKKIQKKRNHRQQQLDQQQHKNNFIDQNYRNLPQYKKRYGSLTQFGKNMKKKKKKNNLCQTQQTPERSQRMCSLTRSPKRSVFSSADLKSQCTSKNLLYNQRDSHVRSLSPEFNPVNMQIIQQAQKFISKKEQKVIPYPTFISPKNRMVNYSPSPENRILSPIESQNKLKRYNINRRKAINQITIDLGNYHLKDKQSKYRERGYKEGVKVKAQKQSYHPNKSTKHKRKTSPQPSKPEYDTPVKQRDTKNPSINRILYKNILRKYQSPQKAQKHRFSNRFVANMIDLSGFRQPYAYCSNQRGSNRFSYSMVNSPMSSFYKKR